MHDNPLFSSFSVSKANFIEIAYMKMQHSLLREATGGLLPELSSMRSVHSVLDLACGEGSFALDLATGAPEIQVTGIENMQDVLEHAHRRAQQRHVTNVYFEMADIRRPLKLPTGSFDLVNANMLTERLSVHNWSSVIAEGKRLLRPGGLFRFLEYEAGMTNSPAHETLRSLYARTIHLLQRSFSPDGRTPDIASAIAGFLREARFQHVQVKSYPIEYSSGVARYHTWSRNFELFFKVRQPFILQGNLVTRADYETLYQRAIYEMNLPSFRALWIYYVISGYRS